MLTPDERAALVVYCSDHPVAMCPQCSQEVRMESIAADPLFGRPHFCPKCRADLTAALRKHLTECTWMDVQMLEAFKRAQETRLDAQKIVKESQQLWDAADVLAREAEDAQRKSCDVKRGQPPAGGAANTLSLAGVRIILVEENADVRDLLEEALSLWGATVTAVACARAAVARVSEADIVVTDVAMGDEDGVWLLAQVNLQPRPIPVIAASGYTVDQYPRMQQAQFARTLLKPVDPEKLAGVIREVLDGR